MNNIVLQDSVALNDCPPDEIAARSLHPRELEWLKGRQQKRGSICARWLAKRLLLSKLTALGYDFKACDVAILSNGGPPVTILPAPIPFQLQLSLSHSQSRAAVLIALSDLK